VLLLFTIFAAIMGATLGIGLCIIFFRQISMLAKVASYAIMGTVFCLMLIYGADSLFGRFGVNIGIMVAGTAFSAAIAESFAKAKSRPNKGKIIIRGAIVGLISGFLVGLAVMSVLGTMRALVLIALYAGNLAVFSGLYDEAQVKKGG